VPQAEGTAKDRLKRLAAANLWGSTDQLPKSDANLEMGMQVPDLLLMQEGGMT
jgi:hypothetical protein